MIRSLISAASGMLAQSLKQDIIANNIANAQTPGFKRGKLVTESFAQALENKVTDLQKGDYPNSPVNSIVTRAQSVQDMSQGAIRNTGNHLDFAIEGPGNFEIATANGTILTRAGNFQINAQGELCTVDGEKVQGQSGAIKVDKTDWNVADDGTIMSNGQAVDKLKIVGAQSETHVLQGSIEEANFNVVREMVDMISNLRSYEANQKVVTFADHTLDKLINEAGRV